MTNTLTTDVKGTIKQINEIHNEGADLVRVSCPDESSSKSLKRNYQSMLMYQLLQIYIFIIKEQLRLQRVEQVV